MRTNSSLIKGLGILELIIKEGSVRIVDVARAFDMPTSNISLFMNSLVSSGYIFKNDMDGRYHLSSKLINMINQADDLNYRYIFEVAMPEMQKLFEKFRENTLIAVLDEMVTRYIGRIQSDHIIQIINAEEEVFPPHVTANGKAILANLSQKELNRYLDRMDNTPFTENSIVEPDILKKELAVVRERGYSINAGEFEPHIMAVGAPLFHGGEVIASLVVQFPDFRHSRSDLEGYAEIIMAASTRITALFN
ncbi:MAG: IclR family transcriptional regulator [Spirochaetales bacterium]|uniref:IclR family transcriptional regulator n=1 Tax=Candidatus Thalassospirochaeta sargassi TaxID=3119039 RepID=A0AAJ1IID2_9SPIO|nr:IclR family transcriptional regulator [Spirochaetales bacterium]